MNEFFLGDLFGITFNRPIQMDSISKLINSFPELVEKKREVDDKNPDEAISEIMNEILDFFEKLEQADRSAFSKLFEEAQEPDNKDISTFDPDETKWNFYIRFKISEPLGLEQDLLCFLEKYTIEPDTNLSLKDSNILVLKTSDSMIYREVLAESKKIEQALILAFAELGIGIAYPESLASEVILEKIKTETEGRFFEENTKIYDNYYERPMIHFTDKFGIILFQEDSLPWNSKATEEKNPVELVNFDRYFSSTYNQLKDFQLEDRSFKKIQIATSILTTSIFSDSLINKIILSMTVIEVLSEKVYRADEELKILDYLLDTMNKDCDANQQIKETLTQALNSVRVQSIGKSCKTLVKNLLGGKKARLFHKLYDYRSQLVHAGILNDDREEMYKIYNDSYGLAKDVLTAYIEKNKSTESFLEII